MWISIIGSICPRSNGDRITGKLIAAGIRTFLLLYALGSLGLQLAFALTGERYWQVAFLALLSHWFLLPAFPALLLALLGRWKKTAALLASLCLIFIALYGRQFTPSFSSVLDARSEKEASDTASLPAEGAGQAEAQADSQIDIETNTKAATEAETQTPSLRLATINTGAYLVESDAVLEAIDWSDADLVALQEIVDVNVPALRQQLESEYPHQFFRAGKAILSRYPLEEPQLFRASDLSARQHIRATLQSPYGPVSIVVAHTEPPVSLPAVPIFLFGKGPAYQLHPSTLEAATNLAQIAAHETRPSILMGDLNLPRRSNAYKAIAKQGLVDSFVEAGWGFGATWPQGLEVWGWMNQPLVRLDYVWHGPHLRATSAEIGPAFGSDHLPLVVDLEFAK